MYPRIVVTLDMIATGTDVKPLECLVFMRSVKSRTYFEQMLGRGVRVITDTEFQSVTDDAKSKDRFIVVDTVGVMDTPLAETVQPLERKPAQSLRDLFKLVAFGSKDPQVASSIAGRLVRLDKHLTRDDRDMLTGLAGGTDMGAIARRLVDALDPTSRLPLPKRQASPLMTEPQSPPRRPSCSLRRSPVYFQLPSLWEQFAGNRRTGRPQLCRPSRRSPARTGLRTAPPSLRA